MGLKKVLLKRCFEILGIKKRRRRMNRILIESKMVVHGWNQRDGGKREDGKSREVGRE